jgi:hypothetical protein
MSGEDWIKLVVLSTGAVAITALAHRQCARMGLPPAVTTVVGGAVLAVVVPALVKG